jgi:TRAP transporter 4TM/12TM fusion protein
VTDSQTQPSLPPQGVFVDRLTRIAGGIMITLGVLWAIEAYRWLGLTFFGQQLLAIAWGLSLFIGYLRYRVRRGHKGPPPLYDWIAAIVGLAAMAWVMFDYERLSEEYGDRTTEALVIGCIAVVLSVEAIRRTAGYAFFSVVLFFIVYALFADEIGGDFKGLTVYWDALATDLGLDSGAALGLPLKISVEVVLVFIFFGQLLVSSGGGQFFIDLAMAMVGHRRGGAAKIAVVASAFFGSISGSAISNVASTGVITIPLMRHAGYSGVNAGAIESVASTGGQFMPPIMGAAAFLMSEILEIPYTDIVIAAIVPALLYYFAVFVMVDRVAAKDNVGQVAEELPRLRTVLMEGGHFLLPFVMLLYALFWLWAEPQQAAMYAAGVVVLLGFLRSYRGARMTVAKLIESFGGAGLVMVELVFVVVGAGWVMFILNTTGLGEGFTLFLLKQAGESLFLLLLIAAFASIILGMGMPTGAVYLLLAAMIAPAISEAGVAPISAHMFILYFGMMSMITPPVALCAFTAASLTGEDPMRTALRSMMFAWVAYVIPFLFAYSPTLLLQGDWIATVIDITTACIGVCFISAAFVGYAARPMNGAARIFLGAAGLAALLPATLAPWIVFVNVGGFVLGALYLTQDIMANRRATRERTNTPAV